MRIKTQYLLTMVLFGVVLAVIGGSVIWTNLAVERVLGQENLAHNIEQAAGELNYLTCDYLLFRESQQSIRWESKFSELSDCLSALNSEDPASAAIVANMNANRNRLKAVLEETALAVANAGLSLTDMNRTTVIQISWSRLAVQTLGLFYDASRLSHLFGNRKDRLRQRNLGLIFTLLGLLGAYFVANYLIFSRRILKSIKDLRSGTRIIGSGNLDFNLPVKRQDEIGELARAFNEMTASLKTVTASKSELEREIAERHQAEERFRTTLYSIGDAVITTDVEGRVWHMNPVAEYLTGWTETEAHGKPLDQVFQIVNEETRAEVENPARRVLREGKIVGLANHTLLISQAGREWPIADSGAPIRGANGAVIGVVLVFRDQTEERQAEAAIRESETKYRNLFENMTEEVHFWELVRDEDNRIKTWKLVDANPPTLKTWGRKSLEEIQGKTADEIFGPGSTAHYLAVVEKIMSEGIPYSYEDYFPNLGKHFRFTSIPLGNHFITTGADISSIKKAMIEVERQRGQLEALMEALPVGVILTDAQGGILLANSTDLKIWGGSRPMTDSVDDYGSYKAWWLETGKPVEPEEWASAQAVQKGETVIGQLLEIQRFDGTRGFIHNSAAPVRSADGAIIGSAVAIQDITELHRVQEALVKAREVAEAANRAKSTFLANMSHEIRTPMNGILGMTDLALMKTPDPQVKDFLGYVKESAHHLLEIINDVLDLSRIEAGKVKLIREEFSLYDLIRTTVEPLRPSFEEKGLELRLTIKDGIPKNVIGDRGRLRQVLTNLMVNAYKFTETGKVSISVGSEASPASENKVRLRISVSDTGIGIPSDQMTRIFDSFEQITTSLHSKYSGAGLGLTICKNLVEMMGGDIRIDSAEGVGTDCRFTAELEVAANAAVQARRPTPSPPAVRSLRILAAEDSRVNRIFIETMLKHAGHEVVLVETGRQVLEKLATEKFDLVLMDIRMPDMNGDEAMRVIRHDPPPGVDNGVPVVALTAYALQNERERFMESGFDAYLTKPLEIDQLWAIIEDLAGKRRIPAEGHPANG